MSLDLWTHGVPVSCPECGEGGLAVRAITNVETGLRCKSCGQELILRQGDLYWYKDNDRQTDRQHRNLGDAKGRSA